MKIHYDWRLARVVDDEGNIVDELEWDGPITPNHLSKRLMLMQRGRNLPEVSTLSERFPDAIIDEMGALTDSDWPEIKDSEKAFQKATLELAKMGVADSSGDLDRRIDMLVSAAQELRSSWTCLLYTSDAADE